LYKLVIADDEEDIRNGLANIVKWPELGFKVVAVFEDGRDVISYLKEHEVDVILTDIVMTYQSGLDVARWVHENRRDTIVVILSGYSEFKFAQQSIHYGVKQYLLKPTNLRDLKDTFERIRVLLDKTRDQFQSIAEFYLYFQRSLFCLMLNGIINDEIARELLVYSKFSQFIGDCLWGVIVIKNKYTMVEQELEDCVNLFERDLSQKSNWRSVTVRHYNMIATLILTPTDISIDSYKKELERTIHETISRLNCLFGYQLRPELMLVNSDYYDLFLDRRLKEILQRVDENKKDESISGEKQYWNLMQEALNALDCYNIEYLKKIVESLACEAKKDGKNSNDFLRRLGFSVIMKIRGYYQKQSLLPHMICDNRIYDKIFLENQIKNVKNYILMVIETFEKDIRDDNYNIIDTVCDYVHKHIHEKLTLNDVAAKVYLNSNYLSRLFKERTGENYSDYVMKVRVKKAKELLQDFRLKVYQVSERLGYQDVRHFYKMFRKATGMTPSEYRKYFFDSDC
jgi:two-component system response regulator YesN